MKTYLFDFDGTLVDSMPNYASAMLRILDENNVPYGSDIIKIIAPLGVAGTAEYFIQMGLKMSFDEIIAVMKRYMVEGYLYHIPAKKNVISALETLKQQGASLNILSAGPHITIDPCLKRLGIYDWFDHIWSTDDFGIPKSDPAVYRLAVEKLGVKEENVLFCDDNLHAVKTAKAAGLTVCGVYDESSKEYAEEMKAAADYYIQDFSELLATGGK